MADENDGMDEVLEATLRVALVAAGRLAEVAARSREQAAREAQRASEAEGRRLQARMDAERSAARAQLARVERLDWWDRARPQDIAAAWQAALTWRDADPAAAQATEVLRERIKARYGVDIDGLGAAETAEALTRADEAPTRLATARRHRTGGGGRGTEQG